MIISRSKNMMQRSFEKTLYRFMEIPKSIFDGHFGIYIHVPFCLSKCSFCPFYKELFSEKLKEQYLGAILKEIDGTDIRGKAKWIYFGGGTPNTLSTTDISDIVERIRGRVQIDSLGVELLPALLTDEYLKELKAIGFTKISMGVESFSEQVLNKTGRKTTTYDHVRQLIELAKSLGLWVNVDMMVGLPDQDANAFRQDIKAISTILPDQVTIYPFMIIRGLKAIPSSPSQEQFGLIEEADEKLTGKCGYSRSGVWTFALGDDLYDSSRDELIEDYAGFGPSAFSTYGNWKVVNPELDVYVRNLENGRRMGFVAPKTKASDDWRKFARMLYDLKLDGTCDLPSYIKTFIWLLKLTGYIRQEIPTGKGRLFAHEITKTVVESLPFPVQNPGCVENYDEYLAYKRAG
jgi:coproporphyrinogen III oxidase-like Fe-S oxidoreductase